MQLRQILKEDNAVSPVIGVILMVAITVILAAVIATFVLGLGENLSNTAPQASFNFDYDGSSGSAGPLTITHNSGDSIDVNQLYIRGSHGGTPLSNDWSSLGGSASGSNSKVVAGDSVSFSSIDPDYDLRVIYDDGSNSATLSDDKGPDA